MCVNHGSGTKTRIHAFVKGISVKDSFCDITKGEDSEQTKIS